MSFLLTGGAGSVDSVDCNLEECWSDLALGSIEMPVLAQGKFWIKLL